MPQTLAQLVRAKYPGQYDDLSDADLDAKVRAKYPGVYDDIPRMPMATPVSASEPTTYLGGALRGFGQGALQGAEGFAQGLANAPGAFVRGVGTMLTQNPVTTAQQTAQAIGRIPAAAAAAGTPEGARAWGEGVGELTGTTEIGLAAPLAPKAVGAGARALGRGAAAVSDVVSPDIVGIVSPRGASALRALQRLRTVLDESPKGAPTSAAPAAPSTPFRLPPETTTTWPTSSSPGTVIPAGSVASPSNLAAMQAAAPVPSAQAPAAAAGASPRLYFLKPQAEMPPAPSAAPAAAQGPPVALPKAWQAMPAQASFPPTEIEGSGLAAAFQQELLRRGMAPGEAIPLVLRNKALPADVRAQLVSALEKVARAQAAGGPQ